MGQEIEIILPWTRAGRQAPGPAAGRAPHAGGWPGPGQW